jgi:hypothetical protein
VDTLIARTGLPAHAVIAELTELEFAGAIAPLAGGKWIRRAA